MKFLLVIETPKILTLFKLLIFSKYYIICNTVKAITDIMFL